MSTLKSVQCLHQFLEKGFLSSKILHNQYVCSFSTSNALSRNVRNLNLMKSNVNRQKSKHIQFSEDQIQEKIEEYNIGSRRLALMVGADPDNFSKDDIKSAVRYLFPSDLFEKSALPKLSHPREIFQAKTAIKADSNGRPADFLFYTMNERFYNLMHEIYSHKLALQVIDDKMFKNSQPHQGSFDFDSSLWLTKPQLEKLHLGHDISDAEYDQFIYQMENLLDEPASYKIAKFIMKFRDELPSQKATDDICKVCTDELGQEYVIENGSRKTAKATVKIIRNGSGKVVVNQTPFLEFFPTINDRQIVCAPFFLLGMYLKFDIVASVKGGTSTGSDQLNSSSQAVQNLSKSAMAGAIRLAISKGLRAFIDDEQSEILRRAGLLQPDIRTRERKKPGQHKARKKHTWKKR